MSSDDTPDDFDDRPDFESMTPEEIMIWMEALAKRQSASNEQLTTSANVDNAFRLDDLDDLD